MSENDVDVATRRSLARDLRAIGIDRIPGKRIRRVRRKLLVAGVTQWVDIEEYDTSVPVIEGLADDFFARIAEAALAAGHGRRGKVGRADAYSFDAAALHATGVAWLESSSCA